MLQIGTAYVFDGIDGGWRLWEIDERGGWYSIDWVRMGDIFVMIGYVKRPMNHDMLRVLTRQSYCCVAFDIESHLRPL